MSQLSRPIGMRTLFGDIVTYLAPAPNGEPQTCHDCREPFQPHELVVSHRPKEIVCDRTICVNCFECWSYSRDCICTKCDSHIVIAAEINIFNAVDLISSFHPSQHVELTSPVVQQIKGISIIDNFWTKEIVDSIGLSYENPRSNHQCMIMMSTFLDVAQKLASDTGIFHNSVRIADSDNQAFDLIQGSLHNNKITLEEALAQLKELMYTRQIFPLYLLRCALTWIFDQARERTLEKAANDQMYPSTRQKFIEIYRLCESAVMNSLTPPPRSPVDDNSGDISNEDTITTSSC